jgi:uncharacterized protein YsxB (DUF464 family)
MIKVTVRKHNNNINELVIKGHADYDVLGKDIVCAAVSSIAITTVNNIIALEDSIYCDEDSGLLNIKVNHDTVVNQKLLDNLVRMLTELKTQYPKNIEIRNED